MSLNVKSPAQSFEVLFKTAQTYSGNHIGGFDIPFHVFRFDFPTCVILASLLATSDATVLG